jgi:UDP-glucuronate 4-epimerase
VHLTTGYLPMTIDDLSKSSTRKKSQVYLVTGAAGFIGMHTSLRLLARGDRVLGVDNLNNYYDVTLKKARLERLTCHPNFTFHKLDIAERLGVTELFAREKVQRVIHLAAQAGVRHSLVDPSVYIDTNLQGFSNILEGCRHNNIEHLVYASSSSVYGGNTNFPFSEHDNVDHPISLYAATKKANELMAHSYSHLFRLPTTGLRFFTVYGPWGRPDMALFLFTKAILENKAINVFNNGKMVRDFTYIDDIVEGIIRVIDKVAEPNMQYDSSVPDPANSNAPYRVFNIGNNQPIELMKYINAIEAATGKIAKKNYLPMQPGDMPSTSANNEEIRAWVDFEPNTAVPQGVAQFVKWYRKYFRV